MNIKPLSDHILIEPIKEEEKTQSGIFLPETAEKEKSEQGKIIATGPGKKTDDGKIVPLSVKPGDRVLFQKYGPSEIKIDGKEYLIAREEDILAVVEFFPLGNQIFLGSGSSLRGASHRLKKFIASLLEV